MIAIPRKCRRLIYVTGIACLLSFACTITRVPRYEYTSSVPEVTQIYRWRIESEPHLQSVNLSGDAKKEVNPEALGQFLSYGLKWVDSVRTRLSEDDHFQFFDNPPFDGVIKIVYYGQVNPAGGLQAGVLPNQPDTKPTIHDYSSEMHHDDTEPLVTAVALNRIDSVQVTLVNSANAPVGQIRMARAESSWGTDEEVGASRVAAVIKKVVYGKK